VGGNVISDAFGLVAMVAMMPLIVVQVMGVIYRVRKAAERKAAIPEAIEDYEVIVLWD
jgi:DNA-binding transcriptional regulator YdaS (Cro superfamily)